MRRGLRQLAGLRGNLTTNWLPRIPPQCHSVRARQLRSPE
jgi:hypothetical protein